MLIRSRKKPSVSTMIGSVRMVRIGFRIGVRDPRGRRHRSGRRASRGCSTPVKRRPEAQSAAALIAQAATRRASRFTAGSLGSSARQPPFRGCGSSRAMRRWLPLIILGAAQFVMVLDSSVMNVSISQIVADLNTTITGVQSAITAYTLVMAAFMLVGAKLGDILGRDRAFGARPRRVRARLADHGPQPEPHGPADRLVGNRRARRGAGDPGDRRADRGELRRARSARSPTG